MKNSLKYFLLISLTAINWNLSAQSLVQKSYNVKIKQDGKVVPVINGRVKLQKKPFAFKVEFTRSECDSFDGCGVQLYTTLDSTYYNGAPDENKIYIPVLWGIHTYAEPNRNETRDLAICYNGINKFDEPYGLNLWWFAYKVKSNDGSYTRYDKPPRISKKRIKATKTIENIYFAKSRERVPLEEIEDDIYLIFFDQDKNIKFGFDEETKTSNTVKKRLHISWI